jgi:hypothetical protein
MRTPSDTAHDFAIELNVFLLKALTA